MKAWKQGYVGDTTSHIALLHLHYLNALAAFVLVGITYLNQHSVWLIQDSAISTTSTLKEYIHLTWEIPSSGIPTKFWYIFLSYNVMLHLLLFLQALIMIQVSFVLMLQRLECVNIASKTKSSIIYLLMKPRHYVAIMFLYRYIVQDENGYFHSSIQEMNLVIAVCTSLCLLYPDVYIILYMHVYELSAFGRIYWKK